VVIDHDLTLLRSVCSRFVALDLGEVIATGTADEVQAHPRVIEAFLGTSGAAERSRDLAGPEPAPATT
jgi:ABC-type branched-subunit amino acid transport system ATPase component